MFDRIKTVFQKEVTDNFRDRRALTSTLMSTLLGPAIMLLLFFVLGSAFDEQVEKTFELPVIGAEYAPNLVAYIEQNNIEIMDAPADPKEAVRVGDQDVILVIPEGYGESLQSGQPAELQLIVDDSRQASEPAVSRVENVLRRYNNTIASLRLIARGISPQVLNPVDVRTVDVATPQSQAALLLNMMPYFLVFSIFLGGMQLAVDSTAGERERGSLEPLLITPVPRRDLVIGKTAATMLFTLFTVIGTLVAFAVMLKFAPLEDWIGIRVNISLATMLGIFLVSLPMMALAVGIQMTFTAYSRNTKEAQTFLNFLPLLPALPGMVLAFVPVKATVWLMLIPTFGQQILINQIMRQEPVSAVNVLVSVTGTLLISAVLFILAIRLYEREQILFGRPEKK